MYGDDENSESKGDILNYTLIYKVIDDFDPSYFENAYSNKLWMNVMNEEINFIEKNDTWELCKSPKDKKCIGCKWVYKIKRHSDGSIKRYKVRLVAKGFNQKYGINYEETFAHVAR